MATQQDIEFFSGNDVVLDCSFTDESTDLPFDLSGAQQLTYALSKNARSAAALITKTLSDGVVMVNPSNGQVQIVLSAAESEPLNGVYYHEIRVVNALGKKLTLMFGQVTIAVNLIRN